MQLLVCRFEIDVSRMFGHLTGVMKQLILTAKYEPQRPPHLLFFVSPSLKKNCSLTHWLVMEVTYSIYTHSGIATHSRNIHNQPTHPSALSTPLVTLPTLLHPPIAPNLPFPTLYIQDMYRRTLYMFSTCVDALKRKLSSHQGLHQHCNCDSFTWYETICHDRSGHNLK